MTRLAVNIEPAICYGQLLTHRDGVGGRGGWEVERKGWGVGGGGVCGAKRLGQGRISEHGARDMKWSRASPMGTALKGGMLDTGSGGSVKRLESFDGKLNPTCGFQISFQQVNKIFRLPRLARDISRAARPHQVF